MAADGASGKVRISELSFYGDAKKSEYAAQKAEAGLVQDGFKTVREVTTEGVNMYTEAKESVNHVIETGTAHSSVAYNQLREEENLPARLAVISGAGLLGLMVGSLRGRLFKKVLYSTIGAGAGVSFCYPDDAQEAGGVAYEEGRKAVLAGYSLVTGAEPSVESRIVTGARSAYTYIISQWQELTGPAEKGCVEEGEAVV